MSQKLDKDKVIEFLRRSQVSSAEASRVAANRSDYQLAYECQLKARSIDLILEEIQLGKFDLEDIYS